MKAPEEFPSGLFYLTKKLVNYMLRVMLLTFLLLFSNFSVSAHAQSPTFGEISADRASWVVRLRDEFQVEILEDNPAVFDLDLLSYLHRFFSSSPRNARPIHLHASPKSGAKKVWRKDQDRVSIDLFLALNAGDGLYSKGASAPRGLPDGRTEVTIDYTSDLYLQLIDALYPTPDLQRTLLETYHIATDCTGVNDPCDSFKKREFISILGILQDLPIALRQNLRLNRMIRLPDGVSNLGSLNAVADYSNGVIRVTSGAFNTDGDRLGEGTLVHEMGHALWVALPYSLRQKFIDLSWMVDPATGMVILKSGSRNFVSEYSLKMPEEDFAEHFSAYFNEPELLKSHALSKWEWLKTNIFIDTEYVSTGAANAKIRVSAVTPDITPPRFLREPAKSIEVTTQVQGAQVMVRVRIVGLVDDVSGFQEAELDFSSIEKKGVGEEGLRVQVLANETRQDEPDVYVLNKTFDRSKLGAKKLYLGTVRLQDRAGNWDYVFLQNSGLSMELQGTASSEELEKNTLKYETERQRRLSGEIDRNLKPYQSEVKLTEGAAPGLFILHLPKQIDEQKVKLLEIETRFYGVQDFGSGSWRRFERNNDEELNYSIDRKMIERSKSPTGIDLLLDFRQGVNMEKMSLYWVNLRYKTLTYSIFFYHQNEIIVIEPHSIGSDPTPAEIEINDLDIELQKPEGLGDEIIIKTKLPLKGFENGGKVRVVYQTPSGKWVIGESTEIKRGHSEGEVEIKLDRFREGGEYIIREMQIMENSPEGSNPAIHQGHQFKVQKVMSRGIKKTVVVEKPLPPT